MQRSVKEIFDHSILATDGQIGSVDDILFDEDDWHVRYFVVKTGPWLFGRQVLLSPVCVTGIDNEQVAVNLTKDQVKDSPDILSNLPLSRQSEKEYHDYYRWPHYWTTDAQVNEALLSPEGGTSLVMGGGVEIPEGARIDHGSHDPTLRSAKSVIGYAATENGAELGEVQDIQFDDSEWLVTGFNAGTGDHGRTLPVELVERMGPPEEVLEFKGSQGMDSRRTA